MKVKCRECNWCNYIRDADTWVCTLNNKQAECNTKLVSVECNDYFSVESAYHLMGRIDEIASSITENALSEHEKDKHIPM